MCVCVCVCVCVYLCVCTGELKSKSIMVSVLRQKINFMPCHNYACPDQKCKSKRSWPQVHNFDVTNATVTAKKKDIRHFDKSQNVMAGRQGQVISKMDQHVELSLQLGVKICR